jgi:DHA2 family multidrug resistance protein
VSVRPTYSSIITAGFLVTMLITRWPTPPTSVSMVRNLGGSVSVSFAAAMLDERTQFHHACLADHITACNGYGWPTHLAGIGQTVQTQASIMSYLDIFWLLGIMALEVWPVALLLPHLPKGVTPSP